MPGVQSMLSNVVNQKISNSQLLDTCLQQIGEFDLTSETRGQLETYSNEDDIDIRDKAADMFRLIAASKDFQLC